MANNLHPQSQQYIFTNQTKAPKTKDAHGDVRQDKRASTSARIASAQPVRSHIPMRADAMTTKTPRSQNPLIATGPKVPITMWVEPIVKAEVLRRAAESGGELSPSEAGAALLKKGMQADLDMQYGALLTPAFENILKRYMVARDNRLALLLVRIALAVEQIRSIDVNILGRQPKVSPEVLNDILDQSLTDAKKKITRRSRELEELIKEVKSWVVEEKQQEHKA